MKISGVLVSRYVISYDSDCGPCTKFKRAVAFLDAHNRVDFLSLSEADALGLLDKIPEDRRHRSFHLVLPTTEVLSGANAIPELVSLLPSGGIFSRLIAGAPGGMRTTTFVYSVISRLHDEGSCKFVPASSATNLRDKKVPLKRKMSPIESAVAFQPL